MTTTITIARTINIANAPQATTAPVNPSKFKTALTFTIFCDKIA